MATTRIDEIFECIMADHKATAFNPTITHDELITNLIERNVKGVVSLPDFLELYRRIKEAL